MRILINIIACLSVILVVDGILIMATTTFDYQITLPFVLVLIGLNGLIISLFIEEKMNENS